MTAPVTETISDTELEAWLAGEVEKPCEMKDEDKECRRVAEFLAYWVCPTHGPHQEFVCAPHTQRIRNGEPAYCGLGGCPLVARHTWIERIK